MRRGLTIAAAIIALFLIGSRAWGQNEAAPAPAQAKRVLALLPLQTDGVSEVMIVQVARVLRAESPEPGLTGRKALNLEPRDRGENLAAGVWLPWEAR